MGSRVEALKNSWTAPLKLSQMQGSALLQRFWKILMPFVRTPIPP